MITLDQGERPLRYHELQERIGDVSQKMLTATLRQYRTTPTWLPGHGQGSRWERRVKMYK